MISVDQALTTILTETSPMSTESVSYWNALNRVCAQKVAASEPLPPFPASVKDGFAIKLTAEQKNALLLISNSSAEECAVRFEFNVIGASNAGDQVLSIDLKEGECVKINTGAPAPLKADAVIQIEDTISLAKDETTGRDTRIEIVKTSGCGGGGGGVASGVNLRLGQDIRPVGSDIAVGECVVNANMLIGPAQIGICATVGALSIECFKQPTVGLVSTGNELVKPEDSMTSTGKIRDSNKALLNAALRSHGLTGIYDAGIATDDPNSVLQVFKNALEYSDIVISTGGVSMGDKVSL
jgi:gephyrin